MITKKFLMATVLLSAVALFTVVACNRKMNTSPSGTGSALNMAEAILAGTRPDTLVTGKMIFTQKNGTVTMTMNVFIPTKANQQVAVHIHENGACGDLGKAAGGHWNPTNQSHGKWGTGSFHLGDIGNVMLDNKGNGTLTLTTTLWEIGGTGLNNIVGKGIIVHSGVDDFTSQPAGNAGSRIGCGIIAMAKM